MYSFKRKQLLILSILIVTMALVGGCTTKKENSTQKNSVVKTGNIKIQYLGHSAFVFTSSAGITIGTDFWTKNAFTYAEDVPNDLGFTANDSKLTRLLISHNHDDHDYVPFKVKVINGNENGVVKDNPALEEISDVKIGRFKSEHFLESWNEGMMQNAVFAIDMDGIKIVHMGDAHGTMADKTALEELKKKIGNIDILLMPIGSPDNAAVDYSTLKTTLQVMDPKVTIPIHYWKVADKEQFLSNTIKDGYKVEKLDTNTKVITIKDFKDQAPKTIWSLAAGKYSK